MVLPLLIGIGIATAAGIIGPKIVEEITKATHGTVAKATGQKSSVEEFQKKMTDPSFGAVKRSWEKAVQDVEGNLPLHEQIITSLPGGKVLLTAKIKKKFIADLRSRGWSAQEAELIARGGETLYNIGAPAEIAAAVGISSAAEVIGSKTAAKLGTKMISKELAKTGAKALTKKTAAKVITKAAAGGVALGGLYEGAISDISMQVSRRGKVDPMEAAMAGAFGAGTATLIGVPIARWAITKPKASKGLLTVARALDPYEYPGDVIGGGFVRDIRIPILTSVPSTTQTENGKKSGKSKTSSKTPSQTDTRRSDRKWVPGYTPTQITSNTDVPVIVPTTTDTPTPSDTPVPSDTPTPTDTPEPDRFKPVPTPNIVDIPDITTYTPDPTIASTVSIPTPTPLARVPPPIPTMLGGSANQPTGPRVSGREAFINEARAARRIFARIMGGY